MIFSCFLSWAVSEEPGGRVPPAQGMPWQAESHPKGCRQGRQSCQQHSLQPQTWQGMSQGPAGHQSGWKRDTAVHTSPLGRWAACRARMLPGDSLGSSTSSTALGSAGTKPMGRVWVEPPKGGWSGQLKPSRALKAPVSQSNYVIYHCLSSSWHGFFVDHFSYPYSLSAFPKSSSLLSTLHFTCCLCLPPPQD